METMWRPPKVELRHNRGRRILSTDPHHSAAHEELGAAAPKYEAPHNRRARLRHVAVSRSGVGIRKFTRLVKEKRKSS
jgi:hypothetical protein